MATTIRTSADTEGLLTITLDLPGKPVNILSRHVLIELDEAISGIERDKPRGVIIASAKPRSFVAGADLVEIRGMSRHQLDEYLALGQAVFTRISRLPIPVVAAINGDCLGGGLELTLGCGWRLAVQDRSVSIGLPETRLGLVPGFGATVRLPRLIGLAPALSMIAAGQTVPPAEARRLGLVDELTSREELLDAARRLLLGLEPAHEPNLRTPHGAADISPQERNHLLDEAEYEAERKSRGHYPAPVRVVGLFRAAFEHGLDAALAAERRVLVELVESPTGRTLIRNFFIRQGARRSAAERAGGSPLPVSRAVVVGGGTMGSGIAQALVRAGIGTTLIEVDRPAAEAAARRVYSFLAEDVAAKRLDEAARSAAAALLHATDEWSDTQDAEILIEAAFEDLPAKQAIMKRLDGTARPEAIVASNTSSLSISDLAGATRHPARVIGLHFFNPVTRMALVEVIRTARSEADALATGVALGARLGKVPILVNDAPGFVVNRILMPYLSESLRMAAEGSPIDQLDAAMQDWGMPMGPFALMDQIGLDVIAGIFRALSPHLAERVASPPALVAAIQKGWLGRKSGRGFYLYAQADPKSVAGRNEELLTLLHHAPASATSTEDVQWRLILTMINEAARILEEGVADSSETIDVATLLGLGMAPFRGGLMHFADSVGPAQGLDRLYDLADRYGTRFTPAALIQELAHAKRPFAEVRA